MRYVLILAVLAAAGFAWKKYNAAPPPPAAEVQDADKTPAANAENRVNNLSGQVPDPF
jgi:hypothetical protein